VEKVYAAERAQLDAAALAELIRRAPDVALPERGALIFPHTKLRDSGALIAAAGRARWSAPGASRF